MCMIANASYWLVDEPDGDGFIYGYVLFRQCKDECLQRGYFQASLSRV
jgi:hypothetical protein